MYKPNNSNALPSDETYSKLLSRLNEERVKNPEYLKNPESIEVSIKNLPTTEKLSILLDELVLEAKNSQSFDEISDIFFSKIKVLSYPKVILQKESINKITFYRARKLSDIRDGDLRLISTFSTPPPFFCKYNGRANISNHPVFYCSDSKSTAVFELKPMVGDAIILTEWEMCSEYDIDVVGVLPRDLREENPFRVLGELLYDNYLKEIIKDFPDKREQLMQLNEFWIKTFLTEPSPYLLSSWFSNIAIYNDDACDILAYPSHETGSLRCNLAMHPNFAQKYLRMTKAYELMVMKDPVDGLSFAYHSYGYVEKRNIKWVPISNKVDISKNISNF
jgi:hypothetical protein